MDRDRQERREAKAPLTSRFRWLVTVLLLLLPLVACSRVIGGKSVALHSQPYRILCVGDSITVGYTDNPSWRVPFEFGYRAPLFELLQTAGIPVQFVGSSQEPWNGLWKVPTNQPVPDLRRLGQDHHEGYGARDTAFVAQHIAGWVAATEPDFVLLMIGLNDIPVRSTNAPCAAETNLAAIVETIVKLRPETHVIVAQITPYTVPISAIQQYNNYIRETLVPAFAARGGRVTTVDQHANFVVPPKGESPRSLYSNGYHHPNAETYRRMARTWFEGIKAALANERTRHDRHQSAGPAGEVSAK